MKKSILQKNWIRWASTGLTLAIMIAIFLFSSQGREQSEGLSFPIGDAVIESGTLNAVKGKVEANGENFWQFVQRLIRKTAHAAEYALLGGLMFVCFESWRGERKLNGLWSLIGGIVYAASDEWHQTMVPGRSGSAEDVLIDAAGVVIGVLVTMGIVWLIKKRMKRKAGQAADNIPA